MHHTNLQPWQHDHTFGQARTSAGERQTLIVAILTATFMVVEIVAGALFGSMALLADGLHMGSHALALGIAVAAYVYARRRATDPRFSFGTGKVNALGGFAGAILLAALSLVMAWESFERLMSPVPIVFDQAIAVAVVGLLVNGLSVGILGLHPHGDGHHHHDHNLRSAYLHVLADALTSVTAIVALLGGKYLGLAWLDPAIGVLGAFLVARWSWGLIRQTSRVLLDHQAPAEIRDDLMRSLEADGDARVADLHLWSIGPRLWAACISVVAREAADPAEYRARIPAGLGIEHVTIEVNRCR